MNFAALPHSVFFLPGDCVARPHSNCYWLIPRGLLAGEHPGNATGAALGKTVDALLDAGIRQFIDLTEEHEPPAAYAGVLREHAGARGIRAVHRRFSITDCSVPTPALMRSILDAIGSALDAGDPVYVHCYAGVGRTGTVIGCLLRHWGFGAQEALELLDRKWGVMEKRTRYPKSPEWPEQFAFIQQWPRKSRNWAG